MASVSSMLLGVALSASVASASTSAYESLPSFAIPSFDYPALGHGATPERLLAELQSNGIVALRNVPNYANVRASYLQKAAECAVAAVDDADATFVSQKQFADGTKRYTISTNAGSELAGSAANTQTKCPGYQELYQEFSQLIENAVNTFGSTLDATSFTASDGAATITSRKLVSEAIRLDHFHAYEAAAASVTAAQRELSYSLPLHEDHGLFIAMSAPKFFEVQERKLVERELAADRSGLVIQTSAGQRVRPVLNEDEVVIMMGTGASRWLKTSHELPAVLHGMKMPESMEGNDNRVLRTWFGKMTLLPAYQRMLTNQNVVFDAQVNATTRLLMETHQSDSDIMNIGCASGRRLQASEGSCVRRECKVKPGKTESGYGCAVVCNRKGHGPEDAKQCADECTCTDTGAGERCWNICVLYLPTDMCAKSNQVCNGQAAACSVPTNAPKTSAPASDTPVPKTPAPVTPAPVTPVPQNPAPSTSASSTPAPIATPQTPKVTDVPTPVPATDAPSKTPAPQKTPESTPAGTQTPTSPAPVPTTATPSSTVTPGTQAPGTQTPGTVAPNTDAPRKNDPGTDDSIDSIDDSSDSTDVSDASGDSYDSIEDSSDSWDSLVPVPSPAPASTTRIPSSTATLTDSSSSSSDSVKTPQPTIKVDAEGENVPASIKPSSSAAAGVGGKSVLVALIAVSVVAVGLQ